MYRCNDASSNPFQRNASVLGRLGQFVEIATAEREHYHFARTFLQSASREMLTLLAHKHPKLSWGYSRLVLLGVVA